VANPDPLDTTPDPPDDATPERLAERLDVIQRFGRTGYFERDPRTGTGWWDEHMYRIWGLPVPPPGTPSPPYEATVDLMHPADRVPGAYERSMAVPGGHSARVRIQRPDGSWRRLHSQWQVIHDAQGQPLRVVGVHTDDTEVYELAEAAKQLHGDLEAALAFGQIGLLHHDLRAGRVHADRRAGEMLGLESRDGNFRLAQLRAQAHPDDRAAASATYLRTLRCGEPGEASVRTPRPGGGWRHTLIRFMPRPGPGDGRDVVLGLIVDVTRVVEQARDAAEAAGRIELAQSALGLGIWHGIAGEDGAWWDRHMFRLRGVDSAPRHVKRAEALSYLHPDDRHLLAGAYRSLDAQARPWQLEYRVVWPDGSVRWVASRSHVVHEPGAARPRHFGVNWDVDDAHRAEEARRESERARAESQAKTQFLSRMSHELRTPLNAVLGFTQLLRRAPQASDAQRATWLAHVEEAGRHLLSLIDDVLDLARADAGQLRLLLRPAGVDEIVASSVALVSGAASERQVRVEVEPDPQAALSCDPVRLRQVLLNLLSNAIKYNRVGGRVRVTTLRSGSEAGVSVRDEGPGLTAEQQRDLFHPFNRLGAERSGVEGTGIGLSIAKLLTETMGGHIELHTAPDQGCDFRVWLPAIDASAVADAPAMTTPEAMPPVDAAPAPTRVLYVEDNPVNALLVREVLRAHPDLQLQVAETGEAGIASARAWQPDVALIDMQLPDMHGLQVMRALRALPGLASLPCVVLSAAALDSEVAEARAAGFDDYWTKPIRIDSFVRDLRALVARSAQAPTA